MKSFIFFVVAFVISLSVHATDKPTKKVESKPAKKAVKTAAKAEKSKSDKRKVANDGITVTPLDPYYPTENLGKGYNTDNKVASEILPREQRDDYFDRTGISKYVVGMDDFDRDMLLMRVRTKSIEEVEKQYPQIPRHSIESLKKALKQ